ncbi:hypothetical protein GPJ59_04090 [Streptomyces bambusae]|uniref:DUF2637 domain-containing protein n=1 Tax=Streptomyces bambusae TaxID=1550616 RepID=A0ABS6Z2U4_9ACTN|nr:hypothetical protein [Streptomyces bambusae]
MGPDLEQHAAFRQPLVGLGEVDGQWDPAEELAFLLQQETAGPRQEEPFDQLGFDEPVEPVSPHGFAGGLPHGPHERPHTATPAGHRRVPRRTPVVTLFQTGSFFTAVLVAVIAAVVSTFSGLAICDALRHSAGPRTAHDVVSWWPLLIYGPWMVASLSILRAALHQRRAIHSWSIVLLFSTLATLLCVAQAPRTFAAQAAATLPPIAALACFQQLVRQITLTRPPRHPVPRHRGRTPSPLRPPATAGGPGTPLPDYSVVDQEAAAPPSLGYGFRYRT